MTVRLCVPPAQLAPGALIVEGDDHAYLFRVRRLATGDTVILFDGHGREAHATVGEVGAARAILDVSEPHAVPRPSPHITVIQSILKGERMDWCIEKLVEVGTDTILLCETERTVARLPPDRLAKRLLRHQTIARESSRQCGRADVPTIAISSPEGGQVHGSQVPGTDAEFGRTATGMYRNGDNPVRLIAEPTASLPLLAAVPADAAAVVLLVGPEGGFAVDELERAAAAGFTPVSLGDTVLRAETAGAAAVFAIRAARAAAAPRTAG